jgi:ABC-2 type transport system permease protein
VSGLLNLVRNENMKIFRRVRTYVLALMVVLVVLLQALPEYLDKQQHGSPDWRTQLEQQTEQYQKMLEDDRLMEMERERLEKQVAVNRFYLENNLNPKPDHGWGQMMRDTVDLMMLVTLLSVVVAGDMVAAEFNWGTIKLLLIRPNSRTKIYLAKYVAVLIFAMFLFAVLFVSGWLVNGVLYGFGGFDDPYVYARGAEMVEQTVGSYTLMAFALEVPTLLLSVTFAFMISAAFRSSSSAIAISMLLLFFGTLAANLMPYDWMKYFLYTNTNLMQYVQGNPLHEGMTVGFSVVMMLLYFVLFHAVGWRVFVKRDVAG